MLRCGGTPCLDKVTLNDLGWKLGTFGPKRCLEAPLPHYFDERHLVVVSHANSVLALVVIPYALRSVIVVMMMMHITVHGRPVRPMGPVYTNRHEGGIKPAKNPTLVSPSASAPRP